MVVNQQIAEIIEGFKEYLRSPEAIQHLKEIETEKVEVKALMLKLSRMDQDSQDFTDDVLFGLLPYYRNKKVARRGSTFPAFMNIKTFFAKYNYTEDDWKILAKRIYNFCNDFNKDPSQLSTLLNRDWTDKYSRRLQCGSITPILFGLHNEYHVVTNMTRNTYRRLCLLMGRRDTLSQKLIDYPENMKKIRVLIEEINDDLLRATEYFTCFCFWYDTARAEEPDEVEDEDEAETEERQALAETKEIDFVAFLESIHVESRQDLNTHSLSDPQRIKIRDIIANTEKTKWVLPHFQRYFDWNKTQIKELWDSIFNDYYIGSFLLWETDKDPDLGIQPIRGVEKTGELKPEAIILDGQQRITSLYYAIKAPAFEVTGSRNSVYYYINFQAYFQKLTHNGYVEVYSTKLSREDTFKRMLFPLYELEKFSSWTDGFEEFIGEKSGNRDKARKIGRIIERKLHHIYDGFEIPYIQLPASMELSQVTEIFEAINTKGKPLNVFDLLIARLYKYELELKDFWDKTRKDYPNIERYNNVVSKMPIYILQAMSLLHEKNSNCQKAEILNIYGNVYEGTDREFVDDWNDTADYMNRALEKLENMRDGFGVNGAKELPFAPTIPLLTALLKLVSDRNNKAECYEKIKQWYWSAVFTQAYSQAVDTQLTLHFKELRAWFDDESAVPEVVTRARREISNVYLTNVQSQSNAKYRGILCLLALEGAKDFDTAQTLETARNNDKDHIFPRAEKYGFGSNKYVNSVLNITWMSDETNRKIKHFKRPSSYTREFIKNKYDNEEQFLNVLKTHLIDKKQYDCMLADDFERFISLREQVLLERIKEAIGDKETNTESALITSKTPFSNKVQFTNTIRSCEHHIYWLDKYFSIHGLEILAQAVDASSVTEIKILLSIEKADEQFRSGFKDFKEEMSNKGVASEVRVITNNKLKANVHDRFLISKYKAFNIPSPDVVARGQLCEITASNNAEALQKEFDALWQGSEDIIVDWNSILRKKAP